MPRRMSGFCIMASLLQQGSAGLKAGASSGASSGAGGATRPVAATVEDDCVAGRGGFI